MSRIASNSFTLRDVARLAEVSVATVSAVLNNKDTVGAVRKQRVEVAIRRLDYRPDALAQSLKTGRSHVIGLVVPDVANPFFTEVMGGVEEVARGRGYSVILSNSNEDPEQELQNIRLLHSRRVDGIILSSSSGQGVFDRSTLRQCPVVYVDRLPSAGFSGRSVTVDNYEGALIATEHLISLGHVRIAIISGRLDLTVGAERLAGFRAALQAANLTIPAAYFETGDFHAVSGYQCGKRLMERTDPPTAIFACNNSMTLGLMRALTELQVPCPEQVSVVAFDDFEWAAYFRPRLTTVAQPVFELGRQAMRMLLGAIDPKSRESANLKQTQLKLKTELKIRQSTGAPPRAEI